MAKHIIHIICGPTAGGKSARALELAQERDGVIINCDSVQIYEGLPILSAQPSAEELDTVPHLLYGHLHPNEICSAGNWREMVEPVIQGVLDNGQTPIVCGGSGLYIKALMEGLSPMPDIPNDIRARAIEMQKTRDAKALHAELQKRDPVMAERLDPNNKARLVRAWEVLEATGKSLAAWQELDKRAPPENWGFQVEILLPEREELYRRCNERFHKMLEMGALEEVENFGARIESGEVIEGTPATKSLGFSQLWGYVRSNTPALTLPHEGGGCEGLANEEESLAQAGRGCPKPISLEDAIARAQAETRHYAKRQVTWFRNQL